MSEQYVEIKWVHKETLDEKTNTLYIDHRKLERKEIKRIVHSPEEWKEIFSEALKHYDSKAILKFKPSNTKRVHIYPSPFGQPIYATEW